MRYLEKSPLVTTWERMRGVLIPFSLVLQRLLKPFSVTMTMDGFSGSVSFRFSAEYPHLVCSHFTALPFCLSDSFLQHSKHGQASPVETQPFVDPPPPPHLDAAFTSLLRAAILLGGSFTTQRLPYFPLTNSANFYPAPVKLPDC